MTIEQALEQLNENRQIPAPEDSYSDLMRLFNMYQTTKSKKDLAVKRILRSGPATIVFWADGDKTVVKRKAGEPDDPYVAFCAAVAIRIYGNNSKLKRMIAEKTEGYKPEDKPWPKEVCANCGYSRSVRFTHFSVLMCDKFRDSFGPNQSCSNWKPKE